MSGPMYTYTADTPQAANPMNTTTSIIQNNFLAIQELLQVNHVSWSDPNASTNLGAHNFVSLPNTTAPGTTSTEIAMFTQVTGSPNPCELYIQYPSGGESSEVTVQISQTTPTPATGTSGGTSTNGWCTFPTGIIFRFGTFSASASSSSYLNITSTGPLYKQYQEPTAVSPASSGCTLSTGMLIYTSSGTSQPALALYAYTSTSVIVNFNYLLIGK